MAIDNLNTKPLLGKIKGYYNDFKKNLIANF